MKKPKKNKQQVAILKKKEPVLYKPSTQKTNIAIFIILAFTFIAYIPSLKAGFVNWDDPDYVSNNPIIKNISNLEMLC